ncbi:MAG: LemA family protein [Nanoarchaeota archaeon]|nr:LemA family protein [Nanoarchaeota archaeon]
MELFLYIIPAVLILWIIIVYNSLISLKNQVQNSFSGIDVQLKRRNDLIPNLVNTVKGYATHERELFENITQIRTSMMNASNNSNIKELAKADDMMTSTLKTLFAVSENYPDLKANENFLNLQNQITRTEDQIAASRRIYNSNVMIFNSKIQVFPNNLVAQSLKFKEFEFFSIQESEKINPNVEL